MDGGLNLRRLEIFCLVIDEGSVTRAAERLFIAQPGVSAQLRALEKSVGAPLYTRGAGKLALTEAGSRLYRWSKEVLAGGVQVQRDIDELASGIAGSLTVASSMAIGTYLLPPLLTKLRAERSGAKITIHASEPAAALHATEIGDVDFAVTTWFDEAAPDSLHAEKLWDEPLVLCAAPHGPPYADEIDIADLPSLPMVGIPIDVAYHRMLVTQLRQHGVGELNVVIHLGHAESVKEAVIANGWTCLAAAYAVTSDVANGRLRTVRIRDAHLVEGIGLHHRTEKFFSPLQTAALDALRRIAAVKTRTNAT